MNEPETIPVIHEEVNCYAYLEEINSNSRNLILSCHPNPIGIVDVPPEKLIFAKSWALSLDAQYSDILRAGRDVRISLPARLSSRSTRVQKENSAEYRSLRLRVGELLHPLFLNSPNLDSLYRFQHDGVRWLINREGCILADDMGLGKTVQVIAAIRLLFNYAKLRSALVICPKGLMVNWEREFNRWAPELGIVILTPQARVRESAWSAIYGRRHVILTNYEQLRIVPSVLTRTTLDLIVADEAHRIRNRSSQTTSGVHQLKAHRIWAITGTPIERDIEDLTNLLSLVAPRDFSPSDSKLPPASIRSRSKKFLLRRRKRNVLNELPDVLDNIEMLELSSGQKRSYRKTIKDYQNSDKLGDSLGLLTKLQALCDIDDKTGASCKVERTISILEQIRSQNEKVVVFSYRLKPLHELKSRITEHWGAKACELLIGELANDERERTVTNFRTDENSFVLLASSRIASEGLTLVEANHVVLFNQWWNPSANQQARDRVVRIGQKRKVRIYRFCCRGTVEESLEKILKSKQDLFDNTIDRLVEDERAVWKRALRDVGINKILSETNL